MWRPGSQGAEGGSARPRDGNHGHGFLVPPRTAAPPGWPRRHGEIVAPTAVLADLGQEASVLALATQAARAAGCGGGSGA
eukprot:11215508-Lingulodinium_polyedra.AAC.1